MSTIDMLDGNRNDAYFMNVDAVLPLTRKLHVYWLRHSHNIMSQINDFEY